MAGDSEFEKALADLEKIEYHPYSPDDGHYDYGFDFEQSAAFINNHKVTLRSALHQSSRAGIGALGEGKLHYYDAACWEYTTEDKSILLENISGNDIMEIGVLKEMPSIFVAQRYNEPKDEYETQEFANKEEAATWQSAITTTQERG